MPTDSSASAGGDPHVSADAAISAVIVNFKLPSF